MKTIKYIIGVGTAIAALASCTKEQTGTEPVAPEAKMVDVTISASQALTKTSMATNGDILWSEGDEIAVTYSTGTYTFALESGAGSTNALFKGQILENSGDPISATYPVGDVVLGGTQEYLDGTFADNTLPMTASYSDGGLVFKADAAVVMTPPIGNFVGTIKLIYTVGETTYEPSMTLVEGDNPSNLIFVVVPGAQKFVLSNGSMGFECKTSVITKAGSRYILSIAPSIDWTADVIEINNADEFMQIYDGLSSVADPGYPKKITKTIKIMNDIDMSGIKLGSTSLSIASRVGVTIDGQDHSIMNVTAESSDGDVALFGKTTVDANSGGYLRIRNLTVKDSKFSTTMPEAAAAAFIGHTANFSLSNCHVDGCEISSTKFAGGFIGYDADGSGERPVFEGCSAKNLTITTNNPSGGSTSAGGFVGYTATPHYLYDCEVENNSITAVYAGAYYGNLNCEGHFKNCSVDGTIATTQAEVDGRPAYGTAIFESDVVNVAKIGDTEYETFEDAIVAAIAANDGTPVVLTSDITYAAGAEFTPVVYNSGAVVIDGGGHTVTGLPGMLFDKKGSGGHYLRISNITFDGANVSGTTGNEAVIVGYADSMNELYFENVTIKNSIVTGSNYAAAFVGYAAGYNKVSDGPVFQQVTFKNCTVENNAITGGGSTGALMGHAAGNTWGKVTVEGTTVKDNRITCTGSSTNKAGSLFGTVGAAGLGTGPDGADAGLFVSAYVSGNTVKSGAATITTICGRQGTVGGTLVMTAGGSYDARPFNELDTWASCADGFELSETDGIWSVIEAAPVAVLDWTADVIEISTAAEFEQIFEGLASVPDPGYPNITSKTIKIMDDIDLNGIEWGSRTLTLNARVGVILDGQGHAIKNLVSTSSTGNVGLFGKTEVNAYSGGFFKIKNLTIMNSQFSTTLAGGSASAFIGYTSNFSMENCHVTNCEIASPKYAGAFIGYDSDGSGNRPVFESCSVSGTTISASNESGASTSAGGFVGYTQTPHFLNNCSVANNTISAKYAGGFYGTLNCDATFTSCTIDGSAATVETACGRSLATATIQ